MTRRAAWTMAAVVVAALPGLAGGPAADGSPESEMIERGRSLYRIYCTGCHGESGTGDGTATGEGRTPPADLTEIARANGGEFPFDRVFRTIAGIDETHAAREMPLWGFAFQELDKDTDQSDEVRGRILQLVHYLRSIQNAPETEHDPRR